MIVEKLLALEVQSYGLFAAVNRTCTLPLFCGVKGCWKMCRFAHCFNRFFSVSVHHSDPWLHLVMKKEISAEVTENHRFFFSNVFPMPSVSRMAWSGFNCPQLTMTFQQVGPSGPITKQMPAFYNQAVPDGSNKEVAVPPPSGWCGRSPVAGHCQLSSTLHFQCLLLFWGKENLKQYLLLLPASVLKAEFIFVMYHCPRIPPYSCPQSVPSWAGGGGTEWPGCHYQKWVSDLSGQILKALVHLEIDFWLESSEGWVLLRDILFNCPKILRGT